MLLPFSSLQFLDPERRHIRGSRAADRMKDTGKALVNAGVKYVKDSANNVKETV